MSYIGVKSGRPIPFPVSFSYTECTRNFTLHSSLVPILPEST